MNKRTPTKENPYFGRDVDSIINEIIREDTVMARQLRKKKRRQSK